MKKIYLSGIIFLWIFSACHSANRIDIWHLPDLPVEKGKYTPDWDSLVKKYNSPEWFRDAKFGIWSHWDPQSIPETGDWSAREMYIQGTEAYKYHLTHYGHPSVFGYKDICHLWTCAAWNPDSLMQMYRDAGAKYFVAMANHHDNFDCWDSKYQPWNAVNVGPKKDVVGIWAHYARKYGLYFGASVHATPAGPGDSSCPSNTAATAAGS